MADPPPPHRGPSTAIKIVGALVVAVVVVVVIGIVVFLRDEAPPPLSVQDVTGATAGSGTGTPAVGLDGTWQVATDGTSQAGLRITEQFVGGLAEHEAVGRTTDISGAVVVSGRSVTSASFTVGLTDLTWSDTPGFPTENRTEAMRGMGLQTDQFPTATFQLTTPIELDAVPADGASVRADAAGKLTLHGTTRDVTIPVDVVRQADRLALATAAPVTVVLADYGIPKPSTPSIAGVADQGSFEFAVALTRA